MGGYSPGPVGVYRLLWCCEGDMKDITENLREVEINDVLFGMGIEDCPLGDMYCLTMFKSHCDIHFQCEYFVDGNECFCLYNKKVT
jgi:hypothetical protein